MSYECQNFKPGQVLSAECLNRMDKGIKDACDSVPPACDKKDCSKILSHGENGHEWIDYPVLTGENATAGDKAWSSKITVDRLCPAFSESGLLVQCEPVEGYPLEVTASGGGNFTATICGKNLYDINTYPMTEKKMIRHSSGNYADSSAFSATEDYIPVFHLRGLTLSIRNAPTKTSGTGSSTAGIAFYRDDKTYISGTDRAKVVVPDDAVYMRFSTDTTFVEEAQIELGENVTDYEPYCGNSADGNGGKSVVTAVKGMNTVFAYSGDNAVEITVAGRANPVAIIDKLTQAVISLGGNI